VSELQISLNGGSLTVASGPIASLLDEKDRSVVAARVNGETRDLSYELEDGDVVEFVALDSAEGLSILRHSLAHITAQAVQELYPQTKLGIGPPITNGYYYDFLTLAPFTPDDLKAIEKKMTEIIKTGQRFVRRVVSEADALSELESEPFKLELIQDKTSVSEDVMETGGAELSIYDNLHLRTGEKMWGDLCRGPHIPDTRYIPHQSFKLMRSAAAYWRGNEKNAQLQRIYGTAWPSKQDLQDFLNFLIEAERRDHRKLGVELDLFSFPDEIGSGLAVFHPKGGVMRRTMEDYSRTRHEASDYEFVYTPHITKAQLFEISGHLDFYKDGMFPAMHMDPELDSDGNIRKPGQDYYLKPMNCPFHNLIFRSRSRSYRELPLRLFEFGSVYRYEKSGVIHGLTRVRGMTQDDAHIYCTQEQMAGELKNLLSFVLNLLRDYGLNDFYLELSTRNDEKYVGTDEEWDKATQALKLAAEESGLDLVPDPGGAAFYGPKISVQVKDALGRTWQMSTIQLDFQMPQRFELEYTASDGSRQRPIMIHRALFGSVERFFGILVEHYGGAFPAWLSPVQVIGIPVGESHNEYLAAIIAQLRERGIRAEVDASDERMQKKIRNAQTQKVPFMLIAGDEDISNAAVSFRYRNGEQKNGVAIESAITEIVNAVEQRL
jgi:threonyl-tRNA synthetase